MRLRKVAFSAFMLATSIYILLPTADEIFIHPAFGFFLCYVLGIPLVYGVLLSVIIYRLVGVTCLFVALVLGGRPIYDRFRVGFAKKSLGSKPNPQNPVLLVGVCIWCLCSRRGVSWGCCG
jgi:hypothetical protein